jgi:hypothetical protein
MWCLRFALGAEAVRPPPPQEHAAAGPGPAKVPLTKAQRKKLAKIEARG